MDMQNENRQVAFIDACKRLKQALPAGASMRVRQTPPPPAPSERQLRSLQTCHRYTPEKPRRHNHPRDSRAYVPELAARLEDDPNLTDGARRCGRKIAELAYRSQREGRALPVTVSFLARAMGRCRRTVQRYLRQLERGGYIAVDVVVGKRSRLCVGLIVRLLTSLLAAHHKARWPEARGNPGATQESQNHRFIGYRQKEGVPIPVGNWALRCMDGVFRSFMKTDPLANFPPVLPT